MALPDRVAFGEFVLERSRQRLCRRDGVQLELTPRLFSALSFFVAHAGELLDKDTLLRELWPSLVVEENNLSQVVSALRRALGDGAQGSRFIQTVPRRGFRFVASVTPLPDAEVPSPAVQAVSGPSPLPAVPASGLSASAGRRWRRPGWHWAAAVVAVAIVVAAGGWAWQRSRHGAEMVGAATLAVLPFTPLQSDQRDELLEVGMAETLATRLSTIPGLVVRSVGSALRFAGPQRDLERAARDLDVAWIVDGSLQREGEQLRVTLRLLRTSDGTAAWSGRFDERFTGVFDMQDQITLRVKQALLSVLQPGSPSAVPLASAGEVGGTRNVEAYRHLLAAHAQMLNQRADGLRRSIAMFQQAVDIDPSYALAWQGLADAYGRLAFVGNAEPGAACSDGERAARRAIALAPALAEARASLAYKLYFCDYDWQAGEQEFRSAIGVNPNAARAHLGLAQLLLTQDRVAEGFVHLRLARELDPLHPVYNALEAALLYNAGRRDEARARLKRTFEIAPRLPLAFLVRAQIHFVEAQPEEGIAALRAAVELAGGAVVFDALLGHYLGRAGQVAEARQILGRLSARSQEGYVAPSTIAAVHAGLGEVEAAVGLLERAYDLRDPRIAFLKDAPYWGPLRGHPRFAALMSRLGLHRFGPGVPHP